MYSMPNALDLDEQMTRHAILGVEWKPANLYACARHKRRAAGGVLTVLATTCNR